MNKIEFAEANMRDQIIISASDKYLELDKCFLKDNIQRLMLVCGASLQHLDIYGYFSSLEKRLGIKVIKFSNFAPNPQYESIVYGVKLFNAEHCDGIIAVGGGSAMDVAKCIKLYAGMDEKINYLLQVPVANNIPLYVAPTTAGTGSEATKFAVIYYNDEKQSITDESILPSVVLFNDNFLTSLPQYQKKATMLDALCHGVESYWSVNSTDESKLYSEKAITTIINNKEGYLKNIPESNKNMLLAAYSSGKAINITQTTAGHAMCYKITNLYGFAHGHSAALCVEKLWPFMLQHIDQCRDNRGANYLNEMFLSLARIFGESTSEKGAKRFSDFLKSLDMDIPICNSEKDFDILVNSVNSIRLKNNPVNIEREQLNMLYHQIVKEKLSYEN